ncbi:substrate-binding domain-containing protein [Marinobacterium arenosum]|uniref:substrate-binding domain-containing protein n=1 Tax=Marinobacterium arenosum TaxID=2862496 RepID=UPI001C984421|nr:substrate-binding domain-containing protein [Marinobacterium arenosum]MBY4678713.1 substrate-binding domain-containing protein [Marinobacterium arenosum]
MFRFPSWKVSLSTTILSALLSFSPWLLAEGDYIRIDSYINQHPEQPAIMAQFADLVRAPAVPLATPPDRPVRIAVIYPGLQASDYWRRSLFSFEQRLKDMQLPYELKPFFSRPSVDASLQSQQLSQALQWQPDYLVFTLDIAPQGRMIERLLARGKPKLILQNITTPLARWQTHRPFLYVGFDHAQGTKLMADWMLKEIDYQGKYLMLYFSPGYVSQMRGDTFASEAAKHPQVLQVGAYYTDGNRKKSHDATIRALKEHPDIKMIFASSTDVALGALEALEETGRQDILLNGWGGGDAELRELQQDRLDVTVMRINDDNGIAMAEAIKLDLQDRPEQVPHIFAGDIKLLDSHWQPAQIQQLKQQAFRLSGLPPETP